MTATAPGKEITAQALGAAIAAVVMGGIQWFFPDIPAPPPGFEAGVAVIAGVAVAYVRKYIARRRMTEKQRAADKELHSCGISEE
jgi:hypothetical protein